MKIFKIKEVSEIIRAYTDTIYHIEANSYEEAIEIIREGNIDPIEYDVDVRDTEFMRYENLNSK